RLTMMMPHVIRIVSFFFLLVGTSLTNQVRGQVNWMSWDEAQARNTKAPRKFIVDVYTQWCGWCKKMDKATWEEPEIASYINKNYYPIKFDAETKDDINFNNRVFKYVRSGPSGYNELAAEITFGRLSYPTIVFLDEKLNVIQPIPGYKDPDSMDKIMKYFAEDYYKTTPWKKYLELTSGGTPVPKGNQ
ncbi:MAG TPA: DUF255 domain-containing protein, partial [Saprospiraceae bacterium]|nr:DUF255 domain-containing protein [Saprospiraceae bacterium]